MKVLVKTMFASVAVFFCISCNTGPSEAETDYEKLMSQNDSLQNIHQNLSDSVDAVRSMHKELQQRISTADSIDSTYLQDMARHVASLQKIQATFKQHDQMLENHNQLKIAKEAGELTDQQLQARVDEMLDHQNSMKSDHDDIRSELESIRSDHQQIMESLQQK